MSGSRQVDTINLWATLGG